MEGWRTKGVKGEHKGDDIGCDACLSIRRPEALYTSREDESDVHATSSLLRDGRLREDLPPTTTP